MNRIQRSVLLAAIASATSATVALAQPAPAENPPAAAATASQPISGTVQAYNFGPNGEAEGLMIKTADGATAQVNFPPHLRDEVTKAAAIGASVKLTGRAAPVPKKGAPDHAVYELVSYTDASGKEVQAGGPREPGKRPDEATGHVEGTIKSLNYDRGGRANGAVLDDGTLVHVGPDAAETLKLAVGAKLSADGRKKATPSGKTVIDADTVNGATIDRPKPPAGGPKPKGPVGEAGDPPPAAPRL